MMLNIRKIERDRKMAKKVKNMLKNNMVLCVMILTAICLTSVVFAADVVIKAGDISATKVSSLAGPTDSNDAARKQYVDDQMGSINSIFGSWTSNDSASNTLVRGEVYKAGSDGFVLVWHSTVDRWMNIYTDGSNPPTTLIMKADSSSIVRHTANAMIPVRADDYVKVTTEYNVSVNMYWLPIGNGSLVKQ